MHRGELDQTLFLMATSEGYIEPVVAVWRGDRKRVGPGKPRLARTAFPTPHIILDPAPIFVNSFSLHYFTRCMY